MDQLYRCAFFPPVGHSPNHQNTFVIGVLRLNDCVAKKTALLHHQEHVFDNTVSVSQCILHLSSLPRKHPASCWTPFFKGNGVVITLRKRNCFSISYSKAWCSAALIFYDFFSPTERNGIIISLIALQRAVLSALH